MNKPWIAVMAIVASSAALIMKPDPAIPAKIKAVNKMDFHEFAERMKGRETFDLTVAGAAHTSFFTGRSYVHYETVAFFGRDDIRSAHQILYHTEEDFTVRHGALEVDLRYSQVRTCLGPSYEKKYGRAELAQPATERERSLRSVIDDSEGDTLLLAEYGLESGKTYHGRLKTESYHLPPRERGGRPERRGKTVLVISDRPFPNDCELTPLYKGWSY